MMVIVTETCSKLYIIEYVFVFRLKDVFVNDKKHSYVRKEFKYKIWHNCKSNKSTSTGASWKSNYHSTSQKNFQPLVETKS